MTHHETITVAVAYVALAFAGPFIVTRLLRWAESKEAASLVVEIGMALERATR
jgi:hypothetical protein